MFGELSPELGGWLLVVAAGIGALVASWR